MRLKRTLVSAIAALGLSASLMVPVALAGAGGDSANVTIPLTEGGTFNVEIDEAAINLTGFTTQAGQGEQTVSGSFNLTYTDTKSFRPTFHTSLDATDFTRVGGEVDSPNPNTPKLIPDDNFFITVLHSPAQTNCCFADGVGGISVVTQAGPPNTSTTYAYWTDKSLGSPQVIHIGWGGAGTVETTENIEFDVKIPAQLPAGTYRTTMTLTVAPPAP